MFGAAPVDIAFDEERGGPRHHNNYLSMPESGAFYRATKKIFAWETCGPHDSGRKIVPSIFVENLFRCAPIPDLSQLRGKRLITFCLDTNRFLVDALSLLVGEGLLRDEEGEQEDDFIVYDYPEDILVKADKLVRELKDNAALQINEDSLEWLEDLSTRAEDAGHQWFAELDLCEASAKCNDLSICMQIRLAIGPHSTVAVRASESSTFYSMVSAGQGGQLGAAMNNFFYNSSAQPVSTMFLANRIVDFFIETQWPEPYRQDFSRLIEYSFDIPRRAAWGTANRQQWVALVQTKLPKAICMHLPTLKMIFADYLRQPAKLVMEVQSLGDAILTGDDASKLPLWKIEEVEGRLQASCGDMVEAEVDLGASTDALLSKLYKQIKDAKRDDKPMADIGGEDFRGPKPGQLARARSEKAFAGLESKFLPTLQLGSATLDKRLNVIKGSLTAKTVLPHTVLFAKSGMRISMYVGQGGDFLALLHDQRHLMSTFTGKNLAYDVDLGKVPDELANYRYDEGEMRKTLDFEFAKLDPLNGCILKMRGEEAGTEFAKYDTKNVYHDGEMLSTIQDLYGKKFEALGYSREVPEEVGLSFRGFIGKIKRIQKIALALDGEEQSGAYAMIDDYVERGYTAAGLNGARKVYGACPADRHLHEWLSADELVVVELNMTLAALSDMATYRRRMGGILVRKTKAAMLTGFSLASGSRHEEPVTPETTGDGKKPGGKPPKQKESTPLKPGKAERGGGKTMVERKRIYPYADGSFSIGTRMLPNDHARKHGGPRRLAHGGIGPRRPSSTETTLPTEALPTEADSMYATSPQWHT